MKTKASVMICDNRFNLRTIESDDTEVLRIWKNEHKEYFFYKKDITEEEQQLWFKAFSERQDDHMFVIEDNLKPIGCIGVRLHNNIVDVYNVILGDKKYKGMHVMTTALWAVVCFSNLIYKGKPASVRVLQSNPAIKWYEKIGFNLIGYNEDHIVMKFENTNFNESFNFKINILLNNKNN